MKLATRRNLTDNAWVKRLDYLAQMWHDIPWETTPDNMEEIIQWLVNEPTDREDEMLDDDDIQALRGIAERDLGL